MNNLAITYKTTADLLPYINNAKKHSADQVTMLAASIKEFGFNNPILTDGDNGVIAGHGRLQAAQKLGLKTVPTIELSHLSESQKKAYILADNRLGEIGVEWDMELVNLELEALNELDFDLSLTGFELDLADENNELQGDPDYIPEPDESEPVTKRGMVWLCGEHRVMCGDSTNADDARRLVNNENVDTVIFDPPYELVDLYNHIPPASLYSKLLVFWDFKRFAIAPAKAIERGWESQYEFIWDCVQSWFTPNRPLQRHKACGYFSADPFFDTERAIIHDGKERKAGIVKNTRGQCDYQPLEGAVHIRTVESFSNASQTDAHGHGKPVEWLQAIYSGIGGRVFFAMFGGSGADMIACEKIGASCLTMELDPRYCDAIVERWELFTGKTASLENDGRKFSDIKNILKSID